ncbi:MAG TPA: 2-oxo-4-hydroxy-4-carboxy-5-ureidoimidazoline decarboxylase [Solirubrobacteraceae bacterium]
MTVVPDTKIRERPEIQLPNRVGITTVRADAIPKVRGEFEYSSDMHMEGMLWGATLRSPHPRADIWAIDIAAALAIPGVHAVLTHADVPGAKTYGMEIADQPVLAINHVRFQGEPVAIVAADHPETARRAADAIAVEYEVLEPLTDAERAMAPGAPELHPSMPDTPRLHGAGNVLRHVRINHGDPDAQADVVVAGEYEVGMQDQAFLGPESGLAVPDGEGGVDLYIATQWLHVDQRQVADSLGLPPEKVRLTLGGVGGAFGGREDLSMQIHACMLALHTGRPVKMAYSREESFFGHVHRHPCRMRYEHGATRDGRLVYVRARIVLDGGAYASSSTAVCANAACFAGGPYDVPNARIDAYVVYTNNPPCGAMRGFGAVQVAFAHEAQMDRLAAALEMDPVELRVRNAMAPGSRMPTGQLIPAPAPVAELLQRVRDMPMPPDQSDGVPGGIANATHGEGVRRGVGYAVAFKNVGFSEGFDDYSTARVRLSLDDGEPLVEVHTAAAEVGQGIVTVQAQIARTELGVERVAVLDADTRVGSAGSSSASRQTYVTGGAVKAACEAVRERLEALAAARGVPPEPASVLGEGEVVEETVEWRHRPTHPLDEDGQGDAHVQYAFSAHRAVVDVDTELGLVRVVELATAQEVGRAMNPQALEGQIEGGSAQGLGLALLEEIQVKDGEVLNASFMDYLLPTILDMPPMRIEVLEHADPEAPYGLKGVGEPPNISTPPAIAAALRAATGRELPRIPVRPEHIVGLQERAVDEEAFVARYGAIFEGSPWVARSAWQRAPFARLDELHDAMVQAVRDALPEQQLALVRAHPELAGREAAAGELTEASTREQASAGLDRLTAGELERWRALNRDYRERFGFPLVVCVREHTKDSILAWAHERLSHEPEQEVEIALLEIAKIARLRLEEIGL